MAGTRIISKSTAPVANPLGYITPSELLGVPDIAFSLSRVVVAGYAGPLFRGRREDTAEEQDFYAKADGTTDINAVALFGGASNVNVVSVYDQTGNFGPLTANTSDGTKIPNIVSGGQVQTINDRLVFTCNADDRLIFSDENAESFFSSLSRVTLVTVGIGTGNLFFQPSDSTAAVFLSVALQDGIESSGRRIFSDNSALITSGGENAGEELFVGVLDGDYVANEHYLSVNNKLDTVTGARDSAGLTAAAGAAGPFRWPHDLGANAFAGNGAELMIWRDAPDSFDRDKLELSIARFYGVA